MPTIGVSPEELLLLSALAPERPGPRFPFVHQLPRLAKLSASEVKRITGQFIDAGAVWKDKDARHQLIPELALALSIVNAPDQVLCFQAPGHRMVARYVFCTRNDRWVKILVAAGETALGVTYPYTRDLLVDWFSEVLLGQETFDQQPFEPGELVISSDGLALLMMMQGTFKQRVEVEAPLTGPDLMISFDDIAAGANLDALSEVSPFDVDTDRLQPLFSNRDWIARTGAELQSQGLLMVDEVALTYSELGRTLFNPAAVRNVVIASKLGVVNQYRTLQAYGGGYLVLEPTVKQGGVRLKLMPPASTEADRRQLFELMTSWEPLTLDAEAAKELVRNLATQGSTN